MNFRRLAVVGLLVATACTADEDPRTIPLPTSPDTTTTTTTTTTPPSTTTTTTTTTTLLPAQYEATVRRTTDGVPHITGRDLASAAYAQGWVSGEDHGCTLVDQIHKVYGVRSERLGAGPDGGNVDSDFAWRSVGLAERAADDFEAAPADVVEQFQAFADGWNDHLNDVGEDGLTGWCNGADWVRPVRPAEVYVYARSVALLASGSRLLDFIPSAQPPTPDVVAGFAPVQSSPEEGGNAPDFSVLQPVDVGSNGWAIGSERTEGDGGGLLVANPHFPWEGELRFTEVHLTVPGEVDIYGSQLIGLPGVGIGFTEGVAWTHTVSAGKRLTAYLLTLDPESPTSYLVDGETRPMTSTDHTISILRPDGSIDEESRTLWHSEFGPVLDFPGLGWTDTQVLTYRDANIDNDEFVEQYLDMVSVESLDDLQAIHEEHQGVPLFNTIATGSDGRVWYADTSATPKLSAEGEQLFVEKLFADPVTQIAYDNGIILLDGSDSRLVWEEVAGARDPGLVPYAEMPMVERTDYVFNANDSFWVPSDEFQLTGEYSIAHGEQNTPLSMRTRQNAGVLATDNRLGLSGEDGIFTADELRRAVFDNSAHTALLLRPSVVAQCTVNPLVEVDEVLATDDTVALPAEVVDVSAACAVLGAWDSRFNLESSGALIWREVMSAFSSDDRSAPGRLFVDPFDPARPTLSPAAPALDPAPLQQALARAVQTLTKAGFSVDSALGAAQFTERSGTRVPIHGGTGAEGITNVVQWSNNASSSEQLPTRGDPVVPGSSLRADGYPVNFGTSFVMTVDYSGDGVQAWALLAYGQTDDRESPLFEQQTVKFSEKVWRPVAFTEAAITADPNLTEQVLVAR